MSKLKRSFAPAGQSTQMIIGATGESDYTLLQTTQALYQGFDLKRVFYSAYIPLNEEAVLPQIGTPPPLLREHRWINSLWKWGLQTMPSCFVFPGLVQSQPAGS